MAPLELLAFKEDKRLCIVEHLKEYLKRTAALREGHSQLLLSYVKPHKPGPKETISRGVKTVLTLAGIDTQLYGAHSSRAASTSSCKDKGLSLTEIMKVAGWTNSGTFARFYSKPLNITNFGQTLLEQ